MTLDGAAPRPMVSPRFRPRSPAPHNFARPMSGLRVERSHSPTGSGQISPVTAIASRRRCWAAPSSLPKWRWM